LHTFDKEQNNKFREITLHNTNLNYSLGNSQLAAIESQPIINTAASTHPSKINSIVAKNVHFLQSIFLQF